MDSSLPKPAPMRRLFELLEEQQEPFLLEMYLLEKGYSKKIPTSETRNNSWIGDSCKKLLTLSSSSTKKNRESSSSTKLLRSALKRLVFYWNTTNCDTKTSDSRRFSLPSCGSDKDRKAHVMELNQLSSASHRTILYSCHSGNAISSTEKLRALDLNNLKKQAAVDGKLQWGCIEDFKQFSPVSVLQPPSDEGSPGHNHIEFYSRVGNGENPFASDFNLPIQVSEDSIPTTCLWDLVGFGSSQYLKSKRVLQQTRQLLFDCVREVVENHARKERRWHKNGCIGPEKLGKIVSDQIISWGKQYGDETNITQMLESDFSESGQQWKRFQPQIREIGIELGDAIFEQIRDEIVTDMLDLFVLERC